MASQKIRQKMTATRQLIPWLVVYGLATTLLPLCTAFLQQSHPSFVISSNHQISQPFTTTTELSMVFDFFRQRTQEGIDQLNYIAIAAQRGELGKGLSDAAAYTAESNKAFSRGLAKSRNRLLQNLEALVTGVSPEKQMEELEDMLLQADLGVSTSEAIMNEIERLREDSLTLISRNDLRSIMRGKLIEALETEQSGAIQFSDDPSIPTILFIMGANGMGKTTTIGKLAHRLRTEGNQTVLMAACDTFRAGAVEQLQQWAERSQVDIVGPTEKVTSPSAVLYSALDKALAEKYDTVLVDTSGRLSNNDALTAELEKMKRVIRKRMSVEKDADGRPLPNMNTPHETLLVLDAAQGRMALDSAKVWNKEIGLTGLILTKLDGSARGGSVVAVSRDLRLPVKLIGVGEGIEDLRDFEPEKFVDGLLGIGVAGGGSSSSEGAMLAARLAEMRRASDTRAMAKKSAPAALPISKMAQVGDSNSQSTPTGRPSRSKTKKNKNKKAGR